MRIIGLTGYSGAGKSTVAGMLAAVLLDRGFSVKLDGFGTPIKKRVAALKSEKGLPAVIDKQADRVAMQNIGSAVRAADPDYYVRCFAARNNWGGEAVQGAQGMSADFLIVPDVRFPAEAEFIRQLGGVLVHVCGCKVPLRGEAAAHASESYFAELFSGADYAIPEQPSLERLTAAVRVLVDAGEHVRKE